MSEGKVLDGRMHGRGHSWVNRGADWPQHWRLFRTLGLVCLLSLSARAADLEEARRLFLSGQYTNCVALAEKAIRDDSYQEEWRLLLANSLLTVGRYAEARSAITNAMVRYPWSLRVRLLAREVFLSNGEKDRADEMPGEMNQLVGTRPWNYRDPPSLVAFGQAALLLGAEPRKVLEKLFDAAKKADPSLREAYLASGELALEKHDFNLAAKTYQEGLKRFPDDPDFHCGLAKAYAPSERPQMIISLTAALRQNTNHLPSLLLMADHLIDGEDYVEAKKLLGHVHTVNAWHPDAWAYQAVVAHLRNDRPQEETARKSALRFWKSNPRVDHLIGWKLSQKYRFTEGAAHQRAALKFDPNYLPAQAQLAQDLLRLGEETEGWQLAQDVHKKDGYDVAAYNLVTLHDTMAKFQTITNRDFILRMTPHEAAVYGPRALALLGQSKSNLCAKYGLTLTQPTIVEVFTQQKDFGVRTFGLPDNPGFLGVCFGPVITANSPAAHAAHPANWEAMLWHEFGHVVTLHLTRNKMPRWLSEGISVYEERQANPAWGEQMNPRYREMILNGELTPVANLSAAFLGPRTEVHLQFAYFESALVVEFLVSRFGLDRLRDILRDLGEGAEINSAIAKHTAPLATIEKDFAAYAHERAAQFAPGLDWEKPTLTDQLSGQDAALAAWAKDRPTNFWALTQQARALIEEKQWREALAPLQRLVELCPACTGPDSAYWLLAQTHRALNETNREVEVLTRFADLDAEAPDTYLRLMELATVAQDWPAVSQNARRFLAVNPLVAPPYRHLAQASEALGEMPPAIESYRTLLQLDPPNPAEVHFHLAQLLHRTGDPSARRHVLQALEEAPRYRAALRLLLELDNKPLPAKTSAATATTESRQ